MLTILGITVAGSFAFGWLAGNQSKTDDMDAKCHTGLINAQFELDKTIDRYEAELTALRRTNSNWNAGWEACDEFHKEMARYNEAYALELQADIATAS